jgi:hypothetical protein
MVGLLVTIVILGVLAAGAFVGVQTMTGTDSRTPTDIGPLTTNSVPHRAGSATSNLAHNACAASADAARSASNVYFANSGFQRYPTSWSELTTRPAALLTLASDDVINPQNPRELDGQGWRLLISGGGATAPIFTCRAAG